MQVAINVFFTKCDWLPSYLTVGLPIKAHQRLILSHLESLIHLPF